MNSALAQPAEMDDVSPVQDSEIQAQIGETSPVVQLEEEAERLEHASETAELVVDKSSVAELANEEEGDKEEEGAEEEALDISALAVEVNERETKSYRLGMAGCSAVLAALTISLWVFSAPKFIKWTVGPIGAFLTYCAVDCIRETKEQKLRAIRQEHGPEVLEQVIDAAAQQKVDMMELEGSLESRLQNRIIQKLDAKAMEKLN